MKKIKEITLFTNGDSNDLSVFSNVPYFFAQTLISKGIKVNRVDIGISKKMEFLYKATIWQVIKLWNRKSTYSYVRSYTHHLHVKQIIKKALEKYPKADVNLFMTFSFSSSLLTKKNTVLFGDWTYKYYFKYFANREPDFLEKQTIKREDSNIENADLVFVLFPSITQYMKEQYSNKNINYIGNVINAMEQPSKANITAQKNKSNKLLFIGNKAYKEGAECLIKSFASLKAHYYDLTLDIIGMQESDFTELPQGVCCHGYLNKGNENDLNIFYELMRESKIFINTTPKWGAFSATLEAMYFYTPIIISPYKEFIETFGPHIDFGYFCELNQTVLLTENIKIILDLPYEKFDKLCVNAHSAVADYSWANYIDKFLEKTESLIIEKEMHR